MGEHRAPIATLGADLSSAGETRLLGSLEAILRATPSFHVEATYGEVAAAACAALLRVFPSRSCTILRRKNSALEFVASQPNGAARALPKVDLERCDSLIRVLARRSPLFLDGPTRWRTKDSDHPLDRRPALWIVMGPETIADLLIILDWQPDEPPPDDGTLLAAQLFGDQVAIALAQAARREYRDEAALLHARLEASLLPRLPASHPLIEVVVRSRPCERRLQLGGDFYDVLALPDGRLAAIVGDVSGHGPDSAALGATLRTTWRALNLAGVDHKALMSLLEEVLVEERASPDMFATALVLSLDRDGVTMRMVNAGHPPPILIGDHPRVLTVPPIGPLGLGLDLPWQPSILALRHPWSMLLYTDGLIEGRQSSGSRGRFGIDGVMAHLQASREQRQRLLDTLLQAAENANGGPLPDDVALVLLSRGGDVRGAADAWASRSSARTTPRSRRPSLRRR